MAFVSSPHETDLREERGEMRGGETMTSLYLPALELRGLPTALRHVAAAAFVIVALGGRQALLGTSAELPFLMFFPAVIGSALFLGRSAGISASLLSAGLADWFYIEPVHSLRIADPGDLLGTGLYGAIAVGTVLLIGAVQATYGKLVEAHGAIERAQAILQSEGIERIKAEAALRASERRYRALVEAGRSVVWRGEPSGTIVEANGWEALTGQALAARGTDGWLNASHPDDRGSVAAAWDTARAAVCALDIEYRLRTGVEGGWRWVWARGVPVFDERSHLVEWVGVVEDIHARRSAVEELRRTRAFLDKVVENIPAMLFAKDPHTGQFVLLNKAGEDLMGLTRSEMIGKTDHDFFPVDQADFFVARDRAVYLSGQREIIEEEPIDTPRWGRRLLRTIKIPIAEDGDQAGFLLGFSEDITDRKRAQEELRALNATLSALIEASPVAIASLGLKLDILTWNRAAEQIFGFPQAELLGRPCGILLPDTEPEALEPLRSQLLAGNVVRGINLPLRRRDGTLMQVRVSGAPLFDGEGSPRGFVICLEDITERQAVEEQLRQSQKMEAVGQLTGGIAHDFNNLLGIIIGNLDLLRGRPNLDEDSAEILNDASEAALRGADLTRRLLAFARRQPLQPRRVDINTLVSGTAKLLHRTLGTTIEVRLSLAADLGAVLVDPTQLATALTNLAVNARHAMPHGGQLVISTRNAFLDAAYAAQHAEVTAGSYVALEVTDTGAGMPPDILARAFEPFFTTKDVGMGTGLGLSMVFGFAKQSDGHVKIYSEVGHGTTVRLYLPEVPETKRDKTTDTSADEMPLAQRCETVLAVEDDDKLRRLLVRQLMELGYTVLEAEGPQLALALLAEGARVDLLLTDVVMPGGISGWELARDATRLRPGLRTVFTSGFPNGAFGSHGGVPEGAHLLAKPYRKEELARMVRRRLAT